MTPDDLAAIRARDAAPYGVSADVVRLIEDRRALLAEVDRLRRVTQVIGDRLDEVLVSNALLTNEAERLRGDVATLAKMQSDEWKAERALVPRRQPLHPRADAGSVPGGLHVNRAAVLAAIDGRLR